MRGRFRSDALAVILVLGAWEGAAAFSPLLRFVASCPSEIGAALLSLVADRLFYWDLTLTVGAALIGLAIGTASGSAVGGAAAQFSSVGRVWLPFARVVSAVPILAIGPAAIVSLGVGLSLKVGCAFFSTVFLAASQTFEAAQHLSISDLSAKSPQAVPLSRALGKFLGPAMADWIAAGAAQNLGAAILGAIFGEFISSESGLGRRMLTAGRLYRTDQVLACCSVLAAVAVICQSLILGFRARLPEVLQRLTVDSKATRSKEKTAA